MDKNKLVKNLIKEKLAILRHHPTSVNIVTKKDYNLIDSMSRYSFWGDWEGSKVNVVYDGLKSFDDDSIERIIEHECCHLADIKESKIMNYSMVHKNQLMNISASYLYEAFRDYVTLERQEKVFSKKKFFNFATKGTQEYKDILIEASENLSKLDRLSILNKFIPEIFKTDYVDFEIEDTYSLKIILNPIEEIFHFSKSLELEPKCILDLMAPALCQYLIKFCPSETLFRNKVVLCFENQNYNIMNDVSKNELYTIQNSLAEYIDSCFDAIKNKEPIESLRPFTSSIRVATSHYKELIGEDF